MRVLKIIVALGSTSSALVLPPRQINARRLALKKATVDGDGNSIQLQHTRVVKLVMPESSVAKKRRVQREEIDKLGEPEAIEAELAAPAPADSTTSVIGSMSSNFGSVIVGNMQKNFWLGTVAPAVIFSLVVKAAVQKSKAVFTKRQTGLVNNYAFEMLKYDGNIATLREVHAEYIQKLGPKQMRDEIVLEYLRRFFAKKTLSGAAVRSLAFIVSINKLDDLKAAKLLVTIGKEFEGKVVSVGKLIFLAERILSDPQALALMQSFKAETTTKSFGDTAEAATQFKTSQAVLAESAVRSFMLDLPESVKDLTDAREAVTEEARLLGMSEDKSMAIFDAVLAEEREQAEAEVSALAASENNEEDALAAIREAALAGDEEKNNSPAATLKGQALIVECTSCRYTLFIAKGREDKFFGPSFKCPDCGAAKDTFNVRPQAKK